MVAAVDEIMTESQLNWTELEGIGVGCTGPVDSARGTIHNSQTLPTWEGCNLVDALHERTSLPVRLENDADTAALGECLFGAGQGSPQVVMLTFGTGVGSSIIRNGHIVRGLNRCHAEFGHMAVARGGEMCECGMRGCLESRAGGASIAKAGKSLGFETTTAVFEAANQGDSEAARIVDAATEATGIAAWNIFHLLAPDRLILGGGMMETHFDIFADRINQILRTAVLIPFRRELVVPATLTNPAGVIGAAALMWIEPEKYESQL